MAVATVRKFDRERVLSGLVGLARSRRTPRRAHRDNARVADAKNLIVDVTSSDTSPSTSRRPPASPPTPSCPVLFEDHSLVPGLSLGRTLSLRSFVAAARKCRCGIQSSRKPRRPSRRCRPDFDASPGPYLMKRNRKIDIVDIAVVPLDDADEVLLVRSDGLRCDPRGPVVVGRKRDCRPRSEASSSP